MNYYYDYVGKFDLLTATEEVELAKKIKKGCQRSREKLVNHNLRLAISIAKKFEKTKCDMDELIAEANVGLCIAVDKYDHTKGFRFSTYATWWIRQRVLKYVGNWGMIKFSSRAKADLYTINKYRNEYQKQFGVEPEFEEIAAFTGFSTNKVATLVNNNRIPVSLDWQAYGDGDSAVTIGDKIEDESVLDPEKNSEIEDIKALIREGIKTLDPLEECVLRLRFGISEQ